MTATEKNPEPGAVCFNESADAYRNSKGQAVTFAEASSLCAGAGDALEVIIDMLSGCITKDELEERRPLIHTALRQIRADLARVNPDFRGGVYERQLK